MWHLAFLLALSTGLACGVAPDAPGVSTRPDVLLITLDTLRADRLGAYGAAPDATPSLDALAARGAVFERALAASSRTAPSHASVFTSRWVRDHSIGYRNGSTRLEGHDTLANLLAEAGYDTAAFVSNSMLRRRLGFDAGFARYDDALPDSEANRPVFERVAEKTTARAVAWLAEPRRAPRFLWVQYNDPHGPYTPPERFVADADEGEALPLPPLRSQRGYQGIPAYQFVNGERDVRRYLARYAGEIRYLDAELGTLLRAFEASAGEHAVLVVTADHGESLGRDGFFFSHGHATTPNLAQVPLLVVAPGVRPQRVATAVHHVDVLPTVLELAGLAIPPEAAGVPLGPATRGEAPLPEDRPLYVDVGAEVSVYRGDTFLRARNGPDLGAVKQGSRQTFRWEGAHWEPRDADPALAALVEAYDRDRAPFAPAPTPSEAQQERLRALGYLEPKAE